MSSPYLDKPDLSQISDAIDVDSKETTDDELQNAIQTQSEQVGPILKEFLTHASENKDYWLKKKSLRILAEWIMSLQDVATLMEQQLEALGSVVTAQEAELEELRPTKKKIWTPFPN